MTDNRYADDQEGLKAIMAPPLRRKEDNEALWQALESGELDAVATDHCPFTFAKQKQQGTKDFTQCPSGAPGVEERLPLMFSEAVKGEHLTIPQVVHYLCTNPGKDRMDCIRRREQSRPVPMQTWYSSIRRRNGLSPQRRCTETQIIPVTRV